MKLHRVCLAIFLVLCCWQMAIGQVIPSKDSILVRHVHQLSSYLTLSVAQERALLVLERQGEHSRDSLAGMPPDPDKRRSVMTAQLGDHDRKLRSLFNGVQWEKYKDLLNARRDAFLKHASDKKITVRELPRQTL
jgi:hypothetical protein